MVRKCPRLFRGVAVVTNRSGLNAAVDAEGGGRGGGVGGDQAVLCLEYIEHDFYVFKNAANGKISVVYKRNHGGVGLIEPDK